MKKLVLVMVLGALLFVAANPAHAVSEAAVLSLMISPGARAAGMGEAFVAMADDATATFWNPAGLAFQHNKELHLPQSTRSGGGEIVPLGIIPYFKICRRRFA